jgi:ribonuclease HIII
MTIVLKDTQLMIIISKLKKLINMTMIYKLTHHYNELVYSIRYMHANYLLKESHTSRSTHIAPRVIFTTEDNRTKIKH